MNGQVGGNRLSPPPVASCNGRGPRLLHLIEAFPSEQSRFVNKACNMAGHDKQTRVERMALAQQTRVTRDSEMRAFLFRCPRTGMAVQGLTDSPDPTGPRKN